MFLCNTCKSVELWRLLHKQTFQLNHSHFPAIIHQLLLLLWITNGVMKFIVTVVVGGTCVMGHLSQ